MEGLFTLLEHSEKIIILKIICDQIPPWLQREMVHCTETEASDGNEADHNSELSDNDECQQQEATRNKAAPTTGHPLLIDCLLSLTSFA